MRISFVLVCLMFSGCFTPMSQSAIQELTSCRNTSLKKIRKNLLLNGYTIKTEGEEDLVTEWKQVEGHSHDKKLRRITVVKMPKEIFKFRVTNRYINVENEREMTWTKSRKKKNQVVSTTTMGIGRNVERSSESPQSYYEERQGDYISVRNEVCGL